MPRPVVLVSDKMQRNYRYELTEPEGRNFDADSAVVSQVVV